MDVIERIKFVRDLMVTMFDKLMADIQLEKEKKKLSGRRPRAEDPDG